MNTTQMTCNSSDKKALIDILQTTQYKIKEDLLNTSEYRDNYNGDRLYDNSLRTESYVSKKANDESEFWKSGKFAYDEKTLKDELIYMTKSREEHKEYDIPDNFKSKEHSMRVTRISEYSNALYNNTIFKNPSFMSC